MSTEVLNTIEGERAISSVNAVKSARWKRGAVGVLFICGTALLGGVAYLKFVSAEPVAEAPKQKDLTTASTVPVRTFVRVPDPEPLPAPALPVQPIVPVAMPSPRPVQNLPVPKAKPTIDRSASRSAVAIDQAGNGIQVAQAQTGQPAPTGGLFGGGGESGGSELGQALQPTKLTSTTASVLSDRNYLLTRGAFIDCALTTRLDSTVPGMTSCTVTRDVFSSNGNVVLVEAGSTVTGEYRANLAQGMARIFVLWSRLETPNGVVINLDSPATDSLGASGVAGHIDTHFWQRFGGAMLLSLIDDAAQIAVNQSSNNDNTQIVLGSAGSAASDLAAEVLRNTINIPPTLYANQGARVGIFVARDLDFSTVYNVQ